MSNNLDLREYEWGVRFRNRRIGVTGNHYGVKFQSTNIHVHSKVISKSMAKMTRFLERSSKSKRGFVWKLGRFDWYEFRECLHTFLSRGLFWRYEDTEKILR